MLSQLPHYRSNPTHIHKGTNTHRHIHTHTLSQLLHSIHINKIASNPYDDISDLVHLVCCSNSVVTPAERG